MLFECIWHQALSATYVHNRLHVVVAPGESVAQFFVVPYRQIKKKDREEKKNF